MTVVTWLDCGHCGGVAIDSTDGLFQEDDGGACISCGLPGCVRVDDDETHAWWDDSQDPNDKCTQADCVECHE